MRIRSSIAAAALLVASSTYADVSEELTFNYPLNDGGQVSVDNINGNVTIIGESRRDVEIVALKKAGTQEYLDEISIVIDHSEDAVSVETEHPSNNGVKNWFSWGDKSGSVTYTIRVPASAELNNIESVNGVIRISGVLGSVRASTVNGNIDAEDLSSSARIETVNGAIEANFTSFGGTQKAMLETVNGRLTVSIPDNADARINAETINGGIDGSDFGLKANKGFVGRDLEAEIGSGSAKLSLSTVNGAIKIRNN